jgi:hypothetical protein
MSNMLLVAWIMHPIFVMEVITCVPILAWITLLVTRSLLTMLKGREHETFAILKCVDNDDLMVCTGAFVSGCMFGTRCWRMVLGHFLRLYLANDFVGLTDNNVKEFLLSFVQLCTMHGYLLLFPPGQL